MNAISKTTEKIPSVDECFRLIAEYKMLPNIVDHSRMVARAAEAVYDRLCATAEHTETLPPRDLILAGGLLHDIAKTPCLNTPKSHAEEGAKICMQLGLPTIAEIVAEHVFIRDPDETRYQAGNFYAKEIIYYADKRIKHDRVVDLDTRLAYILNRYAKDNPQKQEGIRSNFMPCYTLEKFLCQHTATTPETLLDRICLLPFDEE